MLAIQIFSVHLSEGFGAGLNCDIADQCLTFIPVNQTLLHLSKSIEHFAQFTFNCFAREITDP